MRKEIDRALRRKIAENAKLREQFRPLALSQVWLGWVKRFRSFAQPLGLALLFFLSCSLAMLLSRGFGAASLKASGPGDPAAFFQMQDSMVRLMLVGVLAWIGFCMLTTEKITKERAWYMCLPLPDRFFVGSFLRESFWVTVMISTPMGISLATLLVRNHWSVWPALSVSTASSITIAFGIVSGKEWVRRLVPATPMLRRMWVISFVAIFLSLLLTVAPRKKELMEFGAGTMHAAQWLPSGWTFGMLGYGIGLFDELPIGSAAGIIAIVTCFIVSRDGYRISEFVASTTGSLQTQRAEYRAASDQRIEVRLADHADSVENAENATNIENAGRLFVASCVEFELQGLFKSRVVHGTVVVPKKAEALEAGLLGLRHRWRRSTGEIVACLLLLAAFIHLTILATSQWLGSLSIPFLLPWIIASSSFMSANLIGNTTSYGPHARSVAFAVCYLPMSMWDVFCGWILRTRRVVVLKSLSVLSLLLCLYWLGLPGDIAFFLWLFPLHIALLRNASPLALYPIRDNDWRILLYLPPMLPLFMFAPMSSVVSLALLRSNSVAAILCLLGGIGASLACLGITNWMARREFYDWNYK